MWALKIKTDELKDKNEQLETECAMLEIENLYSATEQESKTYFSFISWLSQN